MKTSQETPYPKAFQLVGLNGVTVKRDDVTQYANVLNDATLITSTIENKTHVILCSSDFMTTNVLDQVRC